MADITPDDLARLLRELADDLGDNDPTPLPDGTLEGIGHMALDIIVTRTKMGIDADGHPFAPYAASYTKVRAAKGRRVAPPDLAMTGAMVSSATVDVQPPDTVVLKFLDRRASEIAGYHNEGTRRMAERHWFDVKRPEELQALAEEAGGGVAVAIEARLS